MSLRANLWELMVSDLARQSREHRPQIQRWRNIIDHLSDSAQMGRQEITLEPVEEGWLIEIFSCYDRSSRDPEHAGKTWYILIPRQRGAAPIVSDKWPIGIVDMLAKVSGE